MLNVGVSTKEGRGIVTQTLEFLCANAPILALVNTINDVCIVNAWFGQLSFLEVFLELPTCYLVS